jgi:ATP adenylyltransferase
MNELWAPWRMAYVARPDRSGGCFLCEAAAAGEDRERYVLWRGETCLAVLNCFPYNNGHVLVAPTAHKADLADLTDAELVEQMDMLRRGQACLRKVMYPGGFNIGLNLGSAAGAGIPGHLHWHIVPRWPGDTNFMPVVAETKVIPQSLDRAWELLREAADD